MLLITNFLRIYVLPKVLSGDKEKYLQKKFSKEKCKKNHLNQAWSLDKDGLIFRYSNYN